MLVDKDIIMIGFYDKFTYQMSINRERMTTTQLAHASFIIIISFLLFLSS